MQGQQTFLLPNQSLRYQGFLLPSYRRESRGQHFAKMNGENYIYLELGIVVIHQYLSMCMIALDNVVHLSDFQHNQILFLPQMETAILFPALSTLLQDMLWNIIAENDLLNLLTRASFFLLTMLDVHFCDNNVMGLLTLRMTCHRLLLHHRILLFLMMQEILFEAQSLVEI